MSKISKRQPDAEARMIRKLVEALAEPGARATPSDLEENR